MWIEREKLKPRSERRPVPKAAAAIGTNAKLDLRNPDAMAAYNEAATKQFNERALVPCPNCGRTFFEDRLAIHLRSCRPGNEAARVGTGRIKSATEAVAAATPLKARGPGQTYGGGSGGGMSPGGQMSPSAAASSSSSSSAPRRPPSSGGLRPRGTAPGGPSSPGVTFADQHQGPSSANGKTPRPRAAAAPAAAQHKPSSSASWEDDMNDELDRNAAPPARGYAVPSGGGGDYDDGGDGDDGDGGNLVPCNLCGRRFNADRVAKHETVCRKQQASNAKRAAKIAAKQARMPQPGTQKAAGTDAWKSKHNEFQAAIQYAKKMAAMQKAGVSLASLPPPPRSENADYVTCPYCSRRFNQQAGERHIAACKNIINKPKAVGSNVKPPAAGSMAAQRLQAQQRAGGPVAARPMAGGMGGYGAGAGAGGFGGGGYDDYGYQQQQSPPSQRPSSSGGMQPRVGMAGRPGQLSPPSAAGPSSSARRAPSPGMRSPPSAGVGGVGSSMRAPSPGPAGGAMRRAPSPGPGGRLPSTGPGARAASPGPGGRAGAGARAPPAYGGGGGHGAGGEDLHAKISQLTETVQMLARHLPAANGATTGRGMASGRGGGSSCRSCGQPNPVAAAKFCPHCGSRS